jgi:hypothetical protein
MRKMDECPYCALRYKDFRTGLTFAEVRQMFWVDSEDSRDWIYKRRNTVLGKWRSIKLEMFEQHVLVCKEEYDAQVLATDQ